MTEILVVDDDSDFRESLVVSLTDFGFFCDEATSARGAKKLLRSENYQLIITDILMPEEDGIILITHVRNNHIGSKIIAMSGGGHIGSNSYLQMAEGFGVDGTLEKPFSEVKLINTIKSLGIQPQADL
jgi:DNA-binding NtrC family response regulator